MHLLETSTIRWTPLLLPLLTARASAQMVWTQRIPTTSPPVRVAHAMAFDLRRWRAVLFGGASYHGRGRPA